MFIFTSLSTSHRLRTGKKRAGAQPSRISRVSYPITPVADLMIRANPKAVIKMVRPH